MSRKNRDFFREKLEFSGDISFCLQTSQEGVNRMLTI